MPRVWNRRDPNVPVGAVYVGRPTKWGNPFIIGSDGSRDEVIEKFRRCCLNRDMIENARRELKGKDLVCWCAPLACHADLLLEVANDQT